MATAENWVFTRPHRKLTYVPQTLTILMSVAQGKTWARQRDIHIDFENRLDAAGYKRGGDYLDRKRASQEQRENNYKAWNRGGGGGRTHQTLLEALGLMVHYYDRNTEYASRKEREENSVVLPTLAGQELLNREDPRPILTRQVLAHQFPSAYSINPNVNISDRFRLRPAVLILKLLKHPELGGYLTDLEIGVCAVPYGEKHTDQEANRIARKILAWREHNVRSLPENFRAQYDRLKERHKRYPEVPMTLVGYADTLMKWIDYTGFTVPSTTADGEPCSVLNESMNEEIEQAIIEWGTRPLLDVDPNDPQVFQRKYGVTLNHSRDTRRLGDSTGVTPLERDRLNVLGVLQFEFRTNIITSISAQLVEEVADKTGLEVSRTESILRELLPTPEDGLTPFLRTYRDMAFLGTEEATTFEKATDEIFREVFSLGSKHVGQAGDRRMPDVEVWSDNPQWFGIVDTKAYSRYDLPSDHQLRMQGYVEKYRRQLASANQILNFFMYIAGGFAPSINNRMKTVGDATGIGYCAVNILTWITLIERFSQSSKSGSDLLWLFTLNREVLLADIEQFLNN
ncbi:restriction endonuclease FokI C-terminal domain-containing protein [Rothia sp. (in: high G+C Gram-positive bacteria)]|uniref:restriction endonuclease FokI C-terminal domain-containing protein n=1 Tax=Rothia sp. (in: high G+C Gram-positive bacteria) TaxID=1885016 RepID=UPI000EE09590|nr:hypothetical protein [Rothia sp. (in: high G+C Gram-positive bacteria)]